MRLRQAVVRDLPAVLALNAEAVPATSKLDMEALQDLAAQASRLTVAVNNGDRAVAFMLTLEPGQPYASANYRWFSARYPRFSYVDRVVVAPARRGQGIGAALYADLRAHTPAGVPILCEVNLAPPNPGSLRFHARLGFVEVGQQETEHGAKRVSMLAWAA